MSSTNRTCDFITNEITDIFHKTTVKAAILKYKLSSELLGVKKAIRLSETCLSKKACI